MRDFFSRLLFSWKVLKQVHDAGTSLIFTCEKIDIDMSTRLKQVDEDNIPFLANGQIVDVRGVLSNREEGRHCYIILFFPKDGMSGVPLAPLPLHDNDMALAAVN